MEESELKELLLDVKNNVFLLNGKNIGSDVSNLILEYHNGNWSLQITKDEFYKSTTTNVV